MTAVHAINVEAVILLLVCNFLNFSGSGLQDEHNASFIYHEVAPAPPPRHKLVFKGQRYKIFGNKTLLGEKSAEKLQISENVLIFAFENI